MNSASPCDLLGQVQGSLECAIQSQRDLRCGIDLVDLRQFARDLRLGGNTFLDRIFTQSEQSYCAGRPERLAARLGAKEAFAKALGTGIRGVGWREIEVRSESSGRPIIVLAGRAADLARQRGFADWDLSLTHDGDSAIAVVVARTSNTPPHQSKQS